MAQIKGSGIITIDSKLTTLDVVSCPANEIGGLRRGKMRLTDTSEEIFG